MAEGSKNALARNRLLELRRERLLSKAELARRSGVSTLTIDRVESGKRCRVDTQRKIILALGLLPEDRHLVFGEDEGASPGARITQGMQGPYDGRGNTNQEP